MFFRLLFEVRHSFGLHCIALRGIVYLPLHGSVLRPSHCAALRLAPPPSSCSSLLFPLSPLPPPPPTAALAPPPLLPIFLFLLRLLFSFPSRSSPRYSYYPPPLAPSPFAPHLPRRHPPFANEAARRCLPGERGKKNVAHCSESMRTRPRASGNFRRADIVQP